MTHDERQAEIKRLIAANIAMVPPEYQSQVGHVIMDRGTQIVVQTTYPKGIISSDGHHFSEDDPELPTYAEILMAAVAQRKAFRVLHWMSSDGPQDEFFIVDGRKHVERIPCVICGERAVAKYSIDYPQRAQDGFESVLVGCNCRGVAIHIKADRFHAGRGAMTSCAGSWWNRWQDPAGHPDDFKAAGGVVADAHAVDVMVGGYDG